MKGNEITEVELCFWFLPEKCYVRHRSEATQT
ncbi:D-tagatose-1,6-bisphosphate aldolase subunit KbaY, partial [Yersinia pestis PY-07]